ncbi:MAG: 3-isopropylmalate dehydratase small subunit [Gemmatimonadaceae bacterium]
MPTTPFVAFQSRYVVLDADNVDTDQIIPARFLTTRERTGLGPRAFNDWRHGPDGAPDPAFVLNRPEAAGAQVLVTGRNFGCGSSREHAVWALLGAGFRAVVSAQFADIFFGNALGNGLLPVQVPAAVVGRLMSAPTATRSVHVDLEQQCLLAADGTTAAFPVPPFAKHCMLHGIDELEFLLGAAADIAAYEGSHGARVHTAAQVQPSSHGAHYGGQA